jgi:hypothetical protein
MRAHKKDIFIFLLIVLVLNCLSHAEDSGYQKIDPNKVPDKLIELASIIKTNYEKIRTWKGKMTYHSVHVYRGSIAAEHLKEFAGVELTEEPNELCEIADTNSEFQIDLENNRFYRHMNRPDALNYWNPENGITYKSASGPSQNTKIVTPAYQVNIYPYRRTKDYVTLEKRANKERPIRTEGVDPREAFNVARPIWEVLSRFSQALKMEGVETFGVVIKKKTETDGSTYRVEIFDPGKNQPSGIIILSSEVGFNPVYVEQRHDKGGFTRTTTEFVEIDGIYLPSIWNMSLYYPSDSQLLREVIRTMSDMQVNVPIPDSTFSETSYLREGEKFIDKIQGKEYTYQDGDLIEVEK